VARVLAGRYELEVPLGRGASGEVWRGRDLATRQPVAVKLVGLAKAEDSDMLAETIARFRREAATLARLRHPSIVTALEAGRIGNELFLVMELAEGISLASMLQQRMANNLGLLPVSSVLRVAGQACAGLAAAHSAGVVHRDIKPSNLMVATRLDVKIIDFGIARLLHDNSPRLTLPRQAMGTLAYISPEQLQGIDVDGRADLYALGCVLYEQLAGRQPFMAEIPSALLMMQLKQRAVPLDSIRSDLPVGLARLVDRLMEKDRSARPGDAAEVLGYIAAIGAGVDTGRPVQEADRATIKTWPRGAGKDAGGAAGAPAQAGPEQARGRGEADRQTLVAGRTLPQHAPRTPEAERPTKPRHIQPSAAPPPQVPPPQVPPPQVPPPQDRPSGRA
jgi:serine/threonine-protein kinase